MTEFSSSSHRRFFDIICLSLIFNYITLAQSNLTDPFAICNLFDTFHPNLMICQCKSGYEKEYSQGQARCIPKWKSNTSVLVRRNGFLGGGHHFDNGDLVPVLLGCLAAGLALLACCAGIVQFVRKKHDDTWDDISSGLSSIDHGGLVPYTASSSYLVNRPCCPSHVQLIEQEMELFQDLPPSYEEAIQQSAPVKFLPVPQFVKAQT